MSSLELQSQEARRREAGHKKETLPADVSASPERRQKMPRDSYKRFSLKDVLPDRAMTRTIDPPVVSYQELPGLLSNPSLKDLVKIARLTPTMIKTLTTDIARARELTIARRAQILDELYIMADNARTRYETLKINQAQVDKYTKGIGGKMRGFFFHNAKKAALEEERVGTQALAAWEAVAKVMYLLQISLNRVKHEPLPPEIAPQPAPEERATIGDVVAPVKNPPAQKEPATEPLVEAWEAIHADTWEEEQTQMEPTKKASTLSPTKVELTAITTTPDLGETDWALQIPETGDITSAPTSSSIAVEPSVSTSRVSAPRHIPRPPAEPIQTKRPEQRLERATIVSETSSQIMKELFSYLPLFYSEKKDILDRHPAFIQQLVAELNGCDSTDTPDRRFLISAAAERELKTQKKLPKDRQDTLYMSALARLMALRKS